jgi:large subunit ribosomal protein L15
MRIESLPGDRGKRQKPVRVGRGEGSGKGKTCGRGAKGYLSRAGSKKRLAREGGQLPLIQRLPKRGFRPIRGTVFAAVNVGQLEVFESGADVDPDSLRKAGVVRKKNVPIKILAVGQLSKPLRVRAHAFSAAARQKILDAGGSCEPIDL